MKNGEIGPGRPLVVGGSTAAAAVKLKTGRTRRASGAVSHRSKPKVPSTLVMPY